MRNLRYGLQEKSAHRFNTLVDILSKIARKVSKTRKFKLNQQALISWIVLCFSFHEKSIGTHTYVLKEAEEEKIISTEFLLSYVLPLFAFDFTKWDQVILFLIFYITMSFLCIRHNHFSVNIVLEFLHYRFYNCVIENDDKIRIDTKIISKNRLNILQGQYLRLKSINNDYRIDFSE